MYRALVPYVLASVLLVRAGSHGFAQTNIDSLYLVGQTATGSEQAKAYLDMATHYSQTSPDSCIHYASKALAIGKNLNNALITARSYNHLGGAYQTLSKYKESVRYYLLAVEIAEAIHELGILGSSYNGLGINHYSMGDMAKAEHYIKKAAAAKLEAKDYTYYTVILTNLASLYFYKGQYQEAIDILTAAEGILLKENQREYLPSLYNSMGGLYEMAYADNDSAEYFYKKSLAIALEKNVVNSIISGYHNLGELSFRRKKYAEAIALLKKAEDYSRQTPGNAFIGNVYTTLSEVYETVHDYKNAYKYKNLQLELRNALLEKEKQKAIAELEIKYQTSKKEKEIQRQKEEIQATKLRAEQNRNRLNIIIFTASLLLLTAVFGAIYLWQRRKASRLLEQEKSRVFENIVHEIRTPLALISGPLQLVKKELGPTGKEYVDLIAHNSEKLMRLVNELLDASKLEKGKYLPAYQNGSIPAFVASVIAGFEREAQQKGMTISWSPTEDNTRYRYAADVLEKIIGNLLANAIKYCPPGSDIKIGTEISGNRLVLTVEDNGPGIPEKEQKKIFDRFYRSENTQGITGTGIGLSMVKDLVQLTKGDIKLQSIPGQTRFTVSLPIEKVETEEETISFDESKPHLLVVEDDRDLLKFVGSVFGGDFNMTVAENGQEGIEKIREHLPDIILSDIMMPVKNGIELLQEVKDNVLTNHIPVVVFSAKASLESRLEGLRHGADAYVPKPFSPEELKMVVQNILHTARRNRQEFAEALKTEKPFEARIRSKNEYVNRAIGFIIQNMDNAQYSVNELAGDMCISRSQLHRKLSSLTGFSTTNFIKMVRLEKAKDLLRANSGNVTEVAYACGFSSPSYFSRSFTEYFGESPSGFIKSKDK